MTAVASLALAGVVSTPAYAATFSASTEAELRQAIIDANTSPGADIITLTGSGFTLTAGPIDDITETLTITGPGSATFTLDADTDRPFQSLGSPTNTQFSLSGITIVNSDNGTSAGRSIVTDDLDVVLNDVSVDSQIQHTYGSFSATDVEVGADPYFATQGISIDAGTGDVVMLTRVSVTNAFLAGMDIYAESDADLTLTDVTVTGSSDDDAGGIMVELLDDATIDILDSDISDNYSDGIFLRASGDSQVTLDGVTTHRNTSDGVDADAQGNARVTIRNSSADGNDDRGFESVFEDDSVGNFVAATADANYVGLDIESYNASEVTITDAEARNNDDDGIQVTANGASTITVDNAAAVENDYYGIAAETNDSDSTIDINGGSGEGNTSNGINLDVYSGTINLDGFLARGNDDAGIDIEGDGGLAVIKNSWITDNNEAFRTGGGGVDIDGYDDGYEGALDVLIESTTISGNFGEFGGGIYGFMEEGSTITVLNSTISGNDAPEGGAIMLESNNNAQLILAHSTVTLNESTASSEGSVLPITMLVTISHSIIAGNTSAGAVNDLGNASSGFAIEYSLVETADVGPLGALEEGTGNIVGKRAGLAALADNGGPTLTHAPLASSAVIDAGNPAFTGEPTTDQRGDDRVVNVIDLGALEVQPELAATGASDWLATLAGGTALLFVLVGSLLMLTRRGVRA